MSEKKELNIDIWLPHYMFFLTTCAIGYPKYPNSTTKKKYYDLIVNMPKYFFPENTFSTFFETILDKYPITTYLDNRKSLMKYIWFINNKINEKFERHQLTYDEFYEKYYKLYETENVKWVDFFILKKKMIGIFILIILIVLSNYMYKR